MKIGCSIDMTNVSTGGVLSGSLPGLNNQTLFLPFESQSEGTFVRASNALNPLTLQPLPANLPRIGNQWGFSNQITSADISTWTTLSATVTGGQTDPLGGTTAFKIVCSGANQGAYSTGGTAVGKRCVRSVWLRGDAPGTWAISDTGGASGTVNVTTEWQLFAVATNSLAANMWLRTAGLTTIYAWLPQDTDVSGGLFNELNCYSYLPYGASLGDIPTFTDDFERANTAAGGLGVSSSGFVWTVSGAGAAGAQVVNGKYISTGNTYGAIFHPVVPQTVYGKFSFNGNSGGALICSSDPSLTLAHMIHLQFDWDSCRLTTWNGGAQDVAMSSGSSGGIFPSPLLTDGTVYDVSMTRSGQTITVNIGPYTYVGSDPLVDQLWGRQGIWQVGDGNFFWNSAGSINAPISDNGKKGNAILIEESSSQLFASTNQFSSAPWAGSAPTLAQDLCDPFGFHVTGWTFTDSDAVGLRYKSQPINCTSGNSYTLSWYNKKTTGATVYPAVSIDNASLRFGGATIDTNNGVITKFTSYTGYSIFTTYSVSIESKGDWWFCTLSFVAQDTLAHNFNLIPASTNNPTNAGPTFDSTQTGSSGWAHASLEAIGYSTSMIPNFATSGTLSRGSESFSNNTSGVIPQTTNNLLQSEDFSTTWNNLAETTVLTNQIANPINAVVNADRLSAAAGTSAHRIFQGITSDASKYYTLSVYAKAGTYSDILLVDAGATNRVRYNLATGETTTLAGSPTNITMTDVGGGWYRCSFKSTQLTAGHNLTIAVAQTWGNWTAVGTENVYVWGAQLEQGDLGSYIGTTTAAATGVNGAATIEGWFNFEGVSAAGKTQTLWSTYTGAADYTRLTYSGTQLIFTKAKTGQTTENITYTVSITPNTWGHVAVTLAADGTALMYYNGALASTTNTTSTAFVPVIASTMQVGSYNATLQANGLLDNWRFFNRVLTANEIKAYYLRGQ